MTQTEFNFQLVVTFENSKIFCFPPISHMRLGDHSESKLCCRFVCSGLPCDCFGSGITPSVLLLICPDFPTLTSFFDGVRENAKLAYFTCPV